LPHPDFNNTNAEASIRRAQTVGAESIPEAATHLDAAQKDAARAKSVAQRGYKREAAVLFMRAEADADLATALVEQQHVRAESAVFFDKLRAPRRNP
jgi:hypothetical protein